MTQKPRHIETAGKWRKTGEGMLYAAVARSSGEVLARADFTLMVAEGGSAADGDEILPERARAEIEEEIETVVRQQAVRLLDRRQARGERDQG